MLLGGGRALQRAHARNAALRARVGELEGRHDAVVRLALEFGGELPGPGRSGQAGQDAAGPAQNMQLGEELPVPGRCGQAGQNEARPASQKCGDEGQHVDAWAAGRLAAGTPEQTRERQGGRPAQVSAGSATGDWWAGAPGSSHPQDGASPEDAPRHPPPPAAPTVQPTSAPQQRTLPAPPALAAWFQPAAQGEARLSRQQGEQLLQALVHRLQLLRGGGAPDLDAMSSSSVPTFRSELSSEAGDLDDVGAGTAAMQDEVSAEVVRDASKGVHVIIHHTASGDGSIGCCACATTLQHPAGLTCLLYTLCSVQAAGRLQLQKLRQSGRGLRQ